MFRRPAPDTEQTRWGGYENDSSERFRAAQFNLGDTRTQGEIHGIIQMDHIQRRCRTNAILVFKKYLRDYASSATKETGEHLINQLIEGTGDIEDRQKLIVRLSRMETGARNLYV